MARVLIETARLQELADGIGDLVGCPVTIETPDLRLLAYSRQPNTIDEIRRSTILQKQAPHEVTRALRESGVLRLLSSQDSAVRVNVNGIGLIGRVAVPVKAGGRLVGIIWIHEVNRRLLDSDLRALERAAGDVADEMVRSTELARAQQQRVSKFLFDLAGSDELKEEAVAAEAQSLGIEVPLPYCVVLLDLDKRGEQTQERVAHRRAAAVAGVARQANLGGERAVLVAQRGAEVLMVAGINGRRKQTREGNLASAELEKWLRTELPGKTAAISGPLDRLADLPAAYRQAATCIRTARALGLADSPISCSRFGALFVLPEVAVACSKAGGHAFHSKLEKLLEYEARRVMGFSLVDTLEVYLDSAGKTSLAALRLHVHRNTLDYRLKRITEISGLDLADGIERLAIHLELKLRRFAST